NFQVQQGFDAITFTATQTVGEFTRKLVIRVPTNIEETDPPAEIDEFTFGIGPAVQFTNPNNIVFESVEETGEMDITLKVTAPTWGPKRIEGIINMVDLEDTDFTSTATMSITEITFGINY